MNSKAGITGALLALTGLLGIGILATDQLIREALGGRHFYALIVLVIIDFVIAGYVFAKPSSTAFTAAAGWSLLRIIMQFADLYFAAEIGISYGDFANYLFNPTLTSPPNPTGVPGAFIDLILVLELAVLAIALKARKSA